MNGTLDEEASFIAERWSLEESGSFWVCVDDEDGLDAGVYDVALLVEDEVFSTGFAHVGTDLTATEVTIRNRSEETICFLLAAPYLSTSWGPDRLGETDVLDPGGELTFELVADDYDFRAEDCDLDLLFEEAVDVSVGTLVIIEWSTDGLSVNGEFDGSLDGDLLEGDCISGEPGWSRANTDVVPCEAPHEYQIVGTAPFKSPVSPNHRREPPNLRPGPLGPNAVAGSSAVPVRAVRHSSSCPMAGVLEGESARSSELRTRCRRAPPMSAETTLDRLYPGLLDWLASQDVEYEIHEHGPAVSTSTSPAGPSVRATFDCSLRPS